MTLRGSLDPYGDGLMVMAKRWVLDHPMICVSLSVFQWWDAQSQVNRPHGIAFSNITNGVIRDMKIWKVSSHPSR